MIVPVIAFLLFLMIALPWIVRYAVKESKDSVNLRYKQMALQAAEAGMEKAAWSLTENPAKWVHVMNGGSLTNGTNNTVVFNDLLNNYWDEWAINLTPLTNSFRYSLGISSVSANTIRVVSKGWSTLCPSPTVYRAIEAHFEMTPLDGLTMMNDFDLASTTYPIVHWGAVRSYGSLGVTAPQLNWPSFPRKIATLGISGYRTEPQALNTDSQEFWAFFPNGTAPTLDLAYYQSRARASIPPGTTLEPGTAFAAINDPLAAPQLASPPFSAYFEVYNPTSSFYVRSNYAWSAPGGVLYIKADADGCDTYLGPNLNLNLEAVIFEGENQVVHFSTQGAGTWNGFAPSPADLSKEYAHASGLFIAGSPQALNNVAAIGFIYVDGTLEISSGGGPVNVVGAVYARRIKMGNTGNQFAIYRSSVVAEGVHVLSAPIRRVMYRELGPGEIP